MNNQSNKGKLKEQLQIIKSLIGGLNNPSLNDAVSRTQLFSKNHKFKKLKDGTFIFKLNNYNHIVSINVKSNNIVGFEITNENNINNEIEAIIFTIDSASKKLQLVHEKNPFYVEEETFTYDIDNLLLEKAKSHKCYRGNIKKATLETITYDQNNNNISVICYGAYTTVATSEITTADEKIWLHDSDSDTNIEIDSDLYFLYKIGELSSNDLRPKTLKLKGDKFNNE